MFRPWLIVSLGAVYYCYEYFLRISPSVMTSELMRTYGLDGAQVGNLVAFYYHSYVPMQIVVGLLMDRYGPRFLLTLACLLCSAGTYLFAAGQSMAVAEVGRFLVGFGSAFAFVGALKLATIWLPPNRFGLISGIVMCLGMVGGMSGDYLLVPLVNAFGWKTASYLSAIVGVVLAGVLWAVIRDKNPHASSYHAHVIDFRELFVGLWEALKRPQIWINGVIGLLIYLSLSAFAELWGIAYLEQAHALSSEQAARANSMVFLGWAIGAPFWGWFSDFIKRRVLPITVASILALIFVCIFLYVPNLSLVNLHIVLFAFGLTTSVQIISFAICHEVTHIKIAATAIALTNMIVMVGGNVFQPVVGKLLDLQWKGTMLDGARVYSPHAFKMALSVLPICLALAIILSFFLRETYSSIRGEHL